MAPAYQDETVRDQALDSSLAFAPKSASHRRAYYMAIISFAGIFLFGYDTGLGGGVIALTTFSHEFGLATASKTHLATLQGNIVSILLGGAFFGAIAGAPVADRWGRVNTLWLGCIVFTIGGVIQTACFGSLNQFYIGRLVAGFGVGFMSMACPTYAGEIAPKEIRGRITGMFQIVVTIGVAFSYWINYGVSFMKLSDGPKQWRIPIGFQLVPVGIMMMMLPFLRESPRWLATKHQSDKALKNLAWIRNRPEDDVAVQLEFAEIQAAVKEEEETNKGASWREVFQKGNRVRFLMAFVIFTLQQWSGQNSIGYYAPIIFKDIGLVGPSTGLLASGVYGLVKIVATTIFIMFGVDRFGRKWPLIIGAGLMSMFLWIIGAIYHTHPPVSNAGTTSGASIGMAVMIYLFVIPYCFSVGPLPWVICSEIFSNRTRHYGLMTAAATQWLWNFVVSKCTPLMVIALPNGGMFFFFACINIVSVVIATLFLPETRGLSLEAMDIIFGATTAEERERYLQAQAQEMHIEKGGESVHVEKVRTKETV
ncbi:Quinate permease [Vanrija pseudolonga]|uniref:Quinate permease n=1 Tax=Vanrija pseudolonga TaxID=143232 RepID=A0AAF1BEY2_9TREE|nr:Quinate permease [Vanrija pseudolonga]